MMGFTVTVTQSLGEKPTNSAFVVSENAISTDDVLDLCCRAMVGVGFTAEDVMNQIVDMAADIEHAENERSIDDFAANHGDNGQEEEASEQEEDEESITITNRRPKSPL